MSRPVLILDQHFRTLEELFRPSDFAALERLCEVVGGRNWPMDPREIEAALPRARFLVAARPRLTAEQIERASHLEAVIEVGGNFDPGLDYHACFARGVQVLSCAPGFAPVVAEMTLAMILGAARGLIAEHEAFRKGTERWLEDRPERDFSLFGQDVGFVGFGSIGRECARLMAPFAPRIRAFDPWLDPAVARERGAELVSLDEVLANSRCVVIAANPTSENFRLIDADAIASMPKGALLVLASRSHLVDFEALLDAVERGAIRAAVDVFPVEPVAPDDRLRALGGLTLSPHRAAAAHGGRWTIGEMILDDVRAMLDGRPPSRLQAADPARIASIVGRGEVARAGGDHSS